MTSCSSGDLQGPGRRRRGTAACALIGRAPASPAPGFRSPAVQVAGASHFRVLDAEPPRTKHAAWKPEPHLARGAPGQPGPSDESCPPDESCAQARTSRSATSHSPAGCSRLTCCGAPAARSDGPDGDHCGWCGCGLCRGAHAGPCHHWGLQWRRCWGALKARHHLPGAFGNPASTAGAAWWPLLL